MPALTREESKGIVGKALRQVASFSGDFEGFVFTAFKRYHKRVFIDSIKNQLNAERLDDRRYLDIRLRQRDFDDWADVGACIDWVRGNAGIAVSTDNRTLKRPDLED